MDNYHVFFLRARRLFRDGLWELVLDWSANLHANVKIVLVQQSSFNSGH